MLLNFKQCDKNANKWLMYVNVFLLSQDGVNNLNVSTNESIFFSFVCRICIRTPRKVIEC